MGICVGSCVGICVGLEVGLDEGLDVGLDDGRDVGRTSDCLIVGLPLHFGVGALVGLQPTAKLSSDPRPTLRNLLSDSGMTSA